MIVPAVRCLRAVRLGVRGAASGKVADTAIFKQGTSLPFPLRIMNASMLGQSLLQSLYKQDEEVLQMLAKSSKSSKCPTTKTRNWFKVEGVVVGTGLCLKLHLLWNLGSDGLIRLFGFLDPESLYVHMY